MKRSIAIVVMLFALLMFISCVHVDDYIVSTGAYCAVGSPDVTDAYYTDDNLDVIDDSTSTYLIADGSEVADNCGEDLRDYQYVIDSSAHFRILSVSSLPDPIYYRYEIFNSNGDLVKSQPLWRIAPWISYINDNTLMITSSHGTNFRLVSFYSITDDMFSDVFESPFFLNDELIAYIIRTPDGEYKLVVKDIFNPAAYYKEFPLVDFYLVGSPFFTILNVEYLGDGKIQVIYLTEIDDEVTEASAILY